MSGKPNRAERRRLAFRPTLADSDRADKEQHTDERDKRLERKAQLAEKEQPMWVPGPAAAKEGMQATPKLAAKKKNNNKQEIAAPAVEKKRKQTESAGEEKKSKQEQKKNKKSNDDVVMAETTPKKKEFKKGKKGLLTGVPSPVVASRGPSPAPSPARPAAGKKGAADSGKKVKISPAAAASPAEKKNKKKIDNDNNNDSNDKKKKKSKKIVQEEEEEVENEEEAEDAEPSHDAPKSAQGVEISGDSIYFWKGWPGTWYKARFAVHGESYNSVEQFLCASKARMFEQEDILRRVMASVKPQEQHNLAKHFKPFDAEKWADALPDLLYVANLAKFTQLAGLQRMLLATGERQFVECNPFDLNTGIGLPMKDQTKADSSKWKGQNMLGEALVKVRDDIRSGNYDDVAEDPDEEDDDEDDEEEDDE